MCSSKLVIHVTQKTRGLYPRVQFFVRRREWWMYWTSLYKACSFIVSSLCAECWEAANRIMCTFPAWVFSCVRCFQTAYLHSRKFPLKVECTDCSLCYDSDPPPSSNLKKGLRKKENFGNKNILERRYNGSKSQTLKYSQDRKLSHISWTFQFCKSGMTFDLYCTDGSRGLNVGGCPLKLAPPQILSVSRLWLCYTWCFIERAYQH